MVSVGWAGNLVPFSVMQGDNSSYRGVTVSEQFPYPGKLKLRGRDLPARRRGRGAGRLRGRIRRRISVEVKAAYYDYFYYDQAIQTTKRNKELLEKLSGGSPMRQPTIPHLTRSSLHRCLQLAMESLEAAPGRRRGLVEAEVQGLSDRLFPYRYRGGSNRRGQALSPCRYRQDLEVRLCRTPPRRPRGATPQTSCALLIEAVPAARSTRSFTDNGNLHFTDPTGDSWSPVEIREMIAE